MYTLTGLQVVRSKGYYTVRCIHLQVYKLSGVNVTTQSTMYTLRGLQVVRSKGYYTVQCIHLQVYKLSGAKVINSTMYTLTCFKLSGVKVTTQYDVYT